LERRRRGWGKDREKVVNGERKKEGKSESWGWRVMVKWE